MLNESDAEGRRRVGCEPASLASGARLAGLLDRAAEAARIAAAMREQVLRQLRRRGAIVGLSGGIDSSVTAALAAAALGARTVLGC